jgi:putative molybdopterin biosynthesis protein
MERQVYLEDISLEEALNRLYVSLEKVNGLKPLAGEIIPVSDTLGRVTAQPIWAKISSPHYQAAAMDGIAVKADDTYGASKTSPKKLKIGSQAFWVDTGAPVPLNCDAVIMVEEVQTLENDEIEIRAAVAPWQHVRALGEDIVASELVMPENHLIRPQDMGAMITSGLTDVPVRRKPRAAIIPTGSELVSPGSPLSPGKIIEFNSLMLAKTLEGWGAEARIFPIIPDDMEKITAAVEKSLEDCNLVLILAGSSAGSRDYTSTVVSRIGELLVHGIAMKPGHPVVLGIAGTIPLIGIPGYPVSALLTAELVVKPLVYRLLGNMPPAPQKVKAVITRKLLSPLGQEEFVRVTLGRINNRIVATPLSRGAGIIMSLVRADGILHIPRFSEGVDSGAEVEIELKKLPEEIENTILAIGSHDLALDLLASLLHKYYPRLRLSSAHVGSLGGLLALKRGEAHIAGCHLLDEATGEYNISTIKQVLNGQETVLMNLVYRDQGLMVLKGNPKNITNLSDLSRPDVVFINRQPGSGTRVLLDYKLKQAGIDAGGIKGYSREDSTHTGVAAAVMSGAADVGLGIMAAAKALGLDFIPLLKERYDLAIPRNFYESELLQPLLKIIRGTEYQDIVSSLGGYDTSEMGRVIEIL